MQSEKKHLAFPAVLKTTEGEVLASGHATVLKEEQAINFKSDFVPLYPIGTLMEIVRVENGQEIHRFSGKVYLSNKQLMRLVSVDDILLPGSQAFYNKNLSFPAVLTANLGPAPKKVKRRIFSRAKPQPSEEMNYDITITALSNDGFSFLHPMATTEDTLIKAEQSFLMTAKPPVPLANIKVKIKDVFPFGQNFGYLGLFLDLDPDAQSKLSDFLTQYHLKHHKLF